MRGSRLAIVAALVAIGVVSATLGQVTDWPAEPSAIEVRPLRGLRAEAATLLIQGQAGGSLPVALFASAPDASGTITLVAELTPEAWPPARGTDEESETDTRPRALGSDAEPAPRELEILAYLVDSANAVLAHMQEVVVLPGELSFPEDVDGIRYTGELSLPSGHEVQVGDSVRLLVLDPERRLFQLDTVDLADEALSLPLPQISSPAVWRDVRSSTTTTASQARAALRPVLALGTSTLTLDPRPDFPPDQLVVIVRGPLGVDRTVELETSVEPGSRGPFTLRVQIPRVLRGIYQLAVTYREKPTNRGQSRALRASRSETGEDQPDNDLALVSRPTEVWLTGRGQNHGAIPGSSNNVATKETDVSEPQAGDRMTWPAILRSDPAITRRTTLRALVERELEAQLVAEYAKALREVVNAPPSEVADRLLAGVEARTIRDPDVLQVLGPAQARVELDLVSSDPRTGVALLAIHWRAYRQHRDARRLPLAAQHRRLALGVARTMKQNAPQELLDSAADILTSFSELLLGYGSWLEAGEALDVAVELSPLHATSRFFASLIAEKRGQYEEAVDHIQQALQADASSPWARLRHAVLLERTGQPRAARDELNTLLAGQSHAEVSVLAAQLTAERLAREGQRQEAIRLLDSSLGSHPTSRPLMLQLAQLNESAGNPARAAALIDRWRNAPLDDRPSARNQYSSLPSEIGAELLDRTLTLERVYGPALLARLGS